MPTFPRTMLLLCAATYTAVSSVSAVKADNSHADELVTISSSCNAKTQTGLYYIKPSEDGEIIPVVCHDGYTMLDPSLNFARYSTYFTSLYRYGDANKIMYGTDCSDTGPWRDWYTPADEHTKFRVAKDCGACTPGAEYGDDTAYYMTSGYFCPVEVDSEGCVNVNQDPTLPENPMCHTCDDDQGLCGEGGGRDGVVNGNWCDCFTLQLSPDHRTAGVHSEYCQGGLSWRPNFVVDRTQCTCYQPQHSAVEYSVKRSELPLVSTEFKSVLTTRNKWYMDGLIEWLDDDDADVVDCETNFVYLSNDDFAQGTVRILECGVYVLTEDILVNFNAPAQPFSYADGDSPNNYNLEDLPWFPTTAQQDSGEYFGLNAFWGPFSIGFMAAITIETNHVTVDLNGHRIDMSPEFYLQQRFFAIIELGNKQFEARQGPVDFGRDDIHIQDIVIRNGVLGRSSHHGIHGALASDVTITNVDIQLFDTCGIQCNGCKNMVIDTVDIGPQNVDIPVLGRYVHGRSVLARLRYLVDEFGDETIRFANREKPTTVREIADQFVEQLDMVYYHVMHGVQFDEDDEQWQRAQNTFINPTGWLDGASAYGILLNGEGTAVVNIGRRSTGTRNIKMRNIKIHDLAVNPHENFWASSFDGQSNKILHGFFFETLDWNYGHIFDKDSGVYIGDTYTDILMAANQLLKQDFCPLGSLFFLDGLADWVFTDGKSLWDEDVSVDFRCGSDIQSHSGKGAIGIRIDGTQGFLIENTHIYNLVNWGDLGSDACGEYEQISFETGVDVDKDIQYGYSGNNVHGILTDYCSGTLRDVHVEGLQSFHGSAMAVAFYKGTEARLDGAIQVNDIVAGLKMTQADVEQLKLPNAPPFVCSIFVGPNTEVETSPEKSPVVKLAQDFESSVVQDSVFGYDWCGAANRVGELETPKSPELLDVEERRFDNVMNGEFLFGGTNANSGVLLAALSVLVVAAIYVGHSVRHSDNEKKKNQPSGLSSKQGMYGAV